MTDRKSSSSRTAVVTGAASGIGAATFTTLARDGWRVAAIDRDIDRARHLVETTGAGHLAVAADVSSEEGMVAAFGTVAAEFGSLGALAACAGISDSAPFLELTAADFERIYRINTIGTFLAMREAAKLMPSGGRICTVSSVAGLRGGGVFGTAAYASSKGAILALSKTAARSLAGQGITVNCVVPGPADTAMLAPFWQKAEERERVERMIPLGRPGEAGEIAAAIAWLLSPNASFMTGSTVVADGGMTMY